MLSREDVRDIIRAELSTLKKELRDELKEDIETKVNSIPTTIIRQSAKDGVQEALILLGINTKNPNDAIRWQQNFAYLDNLKSGSEKIKMRIFFGVIGILVTTGAFLFWEGIKEVFKAIIK